MFHLYLTLAYVLPNIYVYARINQLFISKGYKIIFTVIYALLASVYALTNFMEHSANGILQFLSFLAGYLLAFYLYLFLSVLLFDLFLLINYFLRMVPKKARLSFRFRIFTLSTMVLLSVLVVIGGAINLNTIRISEYQVTLPKKNSKIESLRVAFVADIHIQQNLKLNFIKQYVSKVTALKPDIVLYGGDIVEGSGRNEALQEIQSELGKVKTKYGAYGVLGNHEFYGGKQDGSFFRKAGITLLCDTVINIDSLFYLAGRYDQHFRNRVPLDKLTGTIAGDLPFILMDHRPFDLAEVGKTKVDVQFSGHTHNGQLFPLNFIIKKIYELGWGYKKIGNTHFFVTSGLRLWGPPVKTTGKSEIMLVDFKFE